MKFGRCRERRSKSPTPRKGHRSAKLPSQEPLQTSALRSTSSTPGETPPPTSAAFHHGQSHPASVLGATRALSAMGQQGLPKAGWDGWRLAETFEQGPDISSRTCPPSWHFCWGPGAALLLMEWLQVMPGACPPATLAEGFCSWVGKVAAIFACEGGREQGQERS